MFYACRTCNQVYGCIENGKTEECQKCGHGSHAGDCREEAARQQGVSGLCTSCKGGQKNQTTSSLAEKGGGR